MSKFLDGLEPRKTVTYTPVAEAIGDVLRDTVRSVQFGVACAGGGLLITQGKDLASVGYFGLGGFCFALGLASIADIGGRTIGQIAAETIPPLTDAVDLLKERCAIKRDERELLKSQVERAPMKLRVEGFALDGDPGAPSVRRAEFFDLPLSPKQAREMSTFVLNNGDKKISEAKFTGACGHIGGTFWDKTVKPLFLNKYLLIWVNPDNHRAGMLATNKLKALARVILHSPIK